MRENYGEGKVGQGLLLARRLVEGGIRFVEVTAEGWDMHNNLEGDMEELYLSTVYAALIEDLKQRGMLDTTLVVLATSLAENLATTAAVGALPCLLLMRPRRCRHQARLRSWGD